MTHRRLVIWGLASLLVVGAALWIVGAIRSRGGSGGGGVLQGLTSLVADTRTAIEQWCGTQLLAIANAHLRPELRFDKLQYHAPATIILSEVKLIDAGETVVHARSMRIEFTESPRVGQPLVIQSVKLTDPSVRLIPREQGGFLGLSDLLESPSRDRTEQGHSLKPSDFLAIRRIGLINGSISLELPDRPHMMLNQLTFDLTSKPASESPDDKGWYSIDANIARGTLLNWAIKSRLNIDSAVLEVADATWSMTLMPDHYQVLPPDLQAVVRAHEITGDFDATAVGMIPLRDVHSSKLDLDVRLSKGYMALGEYVLPVHSLEIAADMSSGTMTLKPFVLAALGGTMSMEGAVTMDGKYGFNMVVDVKGMRIEEALRPVADRPPKYAGSVDISGALGGQLGALDSTANGTGKLQITDGNLVHVPVLARINDLIAGSSRDARSDRVNADWQVFSDRVAFTGIDLVSSAVAARGDGDIKFDSSLDFRINAGPLERVQSSLGRVGELVGKVTDKFIRYDVTGTLGEPVVTVKTLGADLGIGK